MIYHFDTILPQKDNAIALYYDYLKTWLDARVIQPWQAGVLRVGGLLC